MPHDTSPSSTDRDVEVAYHDDAEKESQPYLKAQEETADNYPGKLKGLGVKLAHWGVELRGIEPVPVDEKIKERYIGMFAFWTSMLCNFLPIVTGMAGTLSYGMSLRDASLTIIFFNILAFAATSWAALMGVRLGFRQMIHARYAFGLYCVSLVIIFNMAGIVGFTMISAIISGQTLAAVSGGTLSTSLGIVLSALIGLVISFMGYRILHYYNTWSWIVILISIIIATGTGGSHLHQQVYAAPANAPLILNFGCLIIGFSLTLIGIMSDYTVYYRPDAPGFRMWLYIFLGQSLPTILLMILGAAIGGAVPNVPAWSDAYAANSAGAVVEAMLRPAGGFGKFIAVLLAFGLIGNIAASMYSISLNFQMLIPPLVHVPRVIFSIVTVAIIIPVGIEAANNFFDSLENFLGLISYWPGSFVAIMLTEHLWFRRNLSSNYDPTIWKDGKRLPSGLAALGAALVSVALIVPSMDELWYVGPIAKHTGDIGFELAFAVSALCYFPFRWIEIRIRGHL